MIEGPRLPNPRIIFTLPDNSTEERVWYHVPARGDAVIFSRDLPGGGLYVVRRVAWSDADVRILLELP